MSGPVFDPQLMNLSSSDLSDSDEMPSPRSSSDPVYIPKVNGFLNELQLGFCVDYHRDEFAKRQRNSDARESLKRKNSDMIKRKERWKCGVI